MYLLCKGFEVKERHTSSFIVFARNCFGHLGSFMVLNEFKDCFFYFNKSAIDILIGTVWNPQITLKSVDILTV